VSVTSITIIKPEGKQGNNVTVNVSIERESKYAEERGGKQETQRGVKGSLNKLFVLGTKRRGSWGVSWGRKARRGGLHSSERKRTT